jgi:hypothetical protein
MVSNDEFDADDPAGPWFEEAPLRAGDLHTTFVDVVDDVTEELIERLTRLELTYRRKKGAYFASCEFGTSVSPDSGEFVRLGTASVLRLMLVVGAYRKCYAKLAAASAAELRAEVAAPGGFAGLDWRRTGYDSAAALVNACREDRWVLDDAAVNRPLLPGIDAKTGNFMFDRTCEVHEICEHLKAVGCTLGMNRYAVGAWSWRKDACEVVAASGDGPLAARVLCHRSVNSRTMDRVYRADLRCKDMGRY